MFSIDRTVATEGQANAARAFRNAKTAKAAISCLDLQSAGILAGAVPSRDLGCYVFGAIPAGHV